MLLERDHILDELDELGRDALAGQGRVVFLVGEAGIGKTSVLRAAAVRLEPHLRLLWAACEDLSAAEALTLLRDLPVIEADALDRANDSGSRLALFNEAIARLRDVPTTLLIEDLHWADDGSIDFVRYLGRRIADQPLLLIISSRNEDLAARVRLGRAANDLPPASRRRFDLARLSSAAVGKLAAAHGLIGSAIHEVTNGNPLLVTEILANGGSRSSSIDDLVVGRADRLDEMARDFLDYCSIIPRRVSLDQVEAHGTPDDALTACMETGLLLTDGAGLAFRHEITRRAVEDALSPLKRKQLHSRELARLEAAGASAARRLHHAIGANDLDTIRRLAPLAARHASSLGAHREAARAWGALLKREAEDLNPEHCQQYAYELHVTADTAGAIEWQERALAIHRAAGDALRQGDALRFLSRLHYVNGDRVLADEAGEAAVTLLEPHSETPELALAYANLAHLAMLADQPRETALWSEKAIPIAHRLGRKDILSTLYNNYGTGLQYSDLERGLDLLDQSIALGIASGSQEHVARAYTNKGWVLMQCRRHGEALSIHDEGILYCRERDLDPWRDYMLGGKALSLLDVGRWGEARETAEPVVLDQNNSYLMRNPAVRALALLAVRRGDPDLERLVEELREHMARGREAPRFTSLALIVAEHCWVSGLDPSEALALLEEAQGLLAPDSSRWDRAALWFWRRKLGDAQDPPADIPVPFACLAKEDIVGAAKAFSKIGLPFEQALALIEGDELQATQGLAILERLSATASAARVRADFIQRGIRRGVRGPRASTRNNGFGLTRREVDVLNAIDKGMTNRQIGERLFVSAKTVDHHVSAILGKLNARTRGEAAAIARERGLLAS
ncbi:MULTISPECIES: AAA family ATPase [Sphingobium]|uniref:LuxR family transcriptional regulator n=1 Tax=Sphingobium fuliginis (strain ATCC 27551) TaxID=336203 RepID=A0ABQ1EX37_SPHSA|nr:MULTISPECIES: AAA family ATPase [Sphingobium]RYL98185.1 helix-turn-helix transcriptional regulator [Sphingobium fuliginis]WDA34902.1 LuxR C-terminal-related transcriptional regulator [Sphingobium sp. YC-XJ3]GFZ91262.1 LuxR family transcriptional regulator [Sphingobium fuliginis]